MLSGTKCFERTIMRATLLTLKVKSGKPIIFTFSL